jgi:hypothetical protein
VAFAKVLNIDKSNIPQMHPPIIFGQFLGIKIPCLEPSVHAASIQNLTMTAGFHREHQITVGIFEGVSALSSLQIKYFYIPIIHASGKQTLVIARKTINPNALDMLCEIIFEQLSFYQKKIFGLRCAPMYHVATNDRLRPMKKHILHLAWQLLAL